MTGFVKNTAAKSTNTGSNGSLFLCYMHTASHTCFQLQLWMCMLTEIVIPGFYLMPAISMARSTAELFVVVILKLAWDCCTFRVNQDCEENWETLRSCSCVQRWEKEIEDETCFPVQLSVLGCCASFLLYCRQRKGAITIIREKNIAGLPLCSRMPHL